MTNELKPCPFCGGNEITIIKDTVDIGGFSYVECLECHATSSWIKGDNYDKWNTRQPAFDWKPIEELEKLDFSEYLDLVFYNEESSSQFQVGSTDFDFKIYMYVGRTYYDKEELKERFTHFDILTPPERR